MPASGSLLRAWAIQVVQPLRSLVCSTLQWVSFPLMVTLVGIGAFFAGLRARLLGGNSTLYI